MQTESQAFNLAIEEVETTISMMNRKIDELINLDERLRAKDSIDKTDAADIDRVFTNTYALEALYSGVSVKDQYMRAMEEINGGVIAACIAFVAAIILAIRTVIKFLSGGVTSSSGGSYSPSAYSSVTNSSTSTLLDSVADVRRVSDSSSTTPVDASVLAKESYEEIITRHLVRLSGDKKKLLLTSIYSQNEKNLCCSFFKEYKKSGIENLTSEKIHRVIKIIGATTNYVKDATRLSSEVIGDIEVYCQKTELGKSPADWVEMTYDAIETINRARNSVMSAESIFNNEIPRLGFNFIDKFKHTGDLFDKWFPAELYADIKSCEKEISQKLALLEKNTETVEKIIENLSSDRTTVAAVVRREVLNVLMAAVKDISRTAQILKFCREEISNSLDVRWVVSDIFYDFIRKENNPDNKVKLNDLRESTINLKKKKQELFN